MALQMQESGSRRFKLPVFLAGIAVFFYVAGVLSIMAL